MKIIYIYLRRHCYNYDNSMFQYYVFKEHGYELEVWSAVNWTFQDKKLDIPINIDKENPCFYINNENDLLCNIKRVKEEQCFFLVYPYHANTIASWTIKKYIKKNGFVYSNVTEDPCFDKSTIDISLNINFFKAFIIEQKRNIKIIIKFLLSCLVFKPDFNILYLGFYDKFYPFIYKSEWNFVTTPLLYYSFPNLFETFSRRNVLIHSSVLDELKRQHDKLSGRFVVFIDQFLSGHSDAKKSGSNHPVKDLDLYLMRLDNLFTIIEKKFDCKVVIAAHPKAEYKEDAFHGRDLFYNRTASLITDALFVIVHYSTCFGNIVLGHKDFLNIYDRDFFINCPRLREVYKILEKKFGCKQLDISDKEQVNCVNDYLYRYNAEKYSSYEERYIKAKGSVYNEKLFYEVVEETISRRLLCE